MNRPLYALAALAASFALIAAACGGDEEGDGDSANPEATATETVAATETAAPTTEATSASTAEADGTATPDDGATTPGVDEAYDSYHHVFSMQMSVDGLGEMFNVSIEGDYVAPDRRSATTTSGAAGFNTTIETVTIGDTSWTRQAGGEWTEFTTGSPPPGGLGVEAMTPSELALDAESRAQIEELDGTPETINGVETTRYELDEEFYQSMASVMGETGFNPSDFEEFSSTIWIDDETDQAIKMELRMVALPSALGAELEGLPIPPESQLTMVINYELSQLDDSSISIEAPTS